MEIGFNNLVDAELIIGNVYKGGTRGNSSDDPLHKLLPRCGNLGGFRKVNRNDDKTKLAYVVLYTSMSEQEWPDSLDEETGIFRYYGDNRNPDKTMLDTNPGGNKLLIKVFSMLNLRDCICDIPPFLVFKKSGKGRDVEFLGLAAPGNPNIPPYNDLLVVRHSTKGRSFINYEAYFSILDTGDETISKIWLKKLIEDHDHSSEFAPKAWINFMERGRDGIKTINKISE